MIIINRISNGLREIIFRLIINYRGNKMTKEYIVLILNYKLSNIEFIKYHNLSQLIKILFLIYLLNNDIKNY